MTRAGTNRGRALHLAGRQGSPRLLWNLHTDLITLWFSPEGVSHVC